MPPPWICNKVLKPNFQFMISQANNGCSLLLHILAKLQLLDISCGNIFAVSIVTACPFSIKKCAKMSVLYVKIIKNRWRLGAMSPHPLGFQRHRRSGGFAPAASPHTTGGLGVSPPDRRWCPPPPFDKSLGAPLVMTLLLSSSKAVRPSALKFFPMRPFMQKVCPPLL